MDIKIARMKAERITNDCCLDCDIKYKVEETTSLLSKDIISGNSEVNRLEQKLASAYLNDTDIDTSDLTNCIIELVEDYVDLSRT